MEVYLSACFQSFRYRRNPQHLTKLVPGTNIARVAPVKAIKLLHHGIFKALTSAGLLFVTSLPSKRVAHAIKLSHQWLGRVVREFKLCKEFVKGRVLALSISLLELIMGKSTLVTFSGDSPKLLNRLWSLTLWEVSVFTPWLYLHRSPKEQVPDAANW
jgi:hypothetical protein